MGMAYGPLLNFQTGSEVWASTSQKKTSDKKEHLDLSMKVTRGVIDTPFSTDTSVWNVSVLMECYILVT